MGPGSVPLGVGLTVYELALTHITVLNSVATLKRHIPGRIFDRFSPISVGGNWVCSMSITSAEKQNLRRTRQVFIARPSVCPPVQHTVVDRLKLG